MCSRQCVLTGAAKQTACPRAWSGMQLWPQARMTAMTAALTVLNPKSKWQEPDCLLYMDCGLAVVLCHKRRTRWTLSFQSPSVRPIRRL